MKELELRHEYKHHINYFDYLAMRKRLQAITKQDENVGESGTYLIRSLYFDNYQDKALREKLDGINKREKFRIRYYNDDLTYIKLEKKSKIYGLCNKQSVTIAKDECEKIIKGDLEWMAASERALLVELYAKMKYQQLRPKTIVEYTREPYIYKPGNVRITFDSKVRTGIGSTNFFDVHTPTIIANEENIIILEVKYDHFLPEIIENCVQLKDRRTSAFSKYVACRTYG
ncbi:polyphosphate polymerase domain-containing protein [Anaerosporobacter faecicola]|uniref:polyphosphate polymerase domain-containing protein n=1 Tax=Anaerosporobacter faecicola TaxID=2718714 RepID=UPI00143B5CCB|nr:polyphosphate polymerase domain-containing protein [Anaerosporobacter faecicola]